MFDSALNGAAHRNTLFEPSPEKRMRISIGNLSVSLALGLLFASAAVAQSAYRPIDSGQQRIAPGMAGAGGTGGAGGGAEPRRGMVVSEADRSSPCAPRGLPTREPITRERLSQAPALDPTRKVNEVDCTKPFDFLGKGNLCCI